MTAKNCTITTDRLELIPFTVDEKQLFLDINTDKYVRKYLWDDEIIDEGAAEEIMQQNRRHFEASQYGLWKMSLKETHAVVGYVGLWYFFDEPQPQLMYALLQPHTKKGYAVESAKGIIEYVFDQLDFAYLIAATDEQHVQSQKVALKSGLKFVEKGWRMISLPCFTE